LPVRNRLRRGRKDGPSGPLPEPKSDERVRVLSGGLDDRGNFLRDVNDIIVQTAERIGTAEMEWRFLCECGRRGCRESVELTLEEYEEIAAEGLVVARRHRNSQAA
jgi:hypothetical protein